MRTLIVAIVLVLLTAPASALCLTGLESDENGYPSGQEDLILCQQNELSVIVDKKAAEERLRLMRSQLMTLDLERNRIQLAPSTPLPPASLLDSPGF